MSSINDEYEKLQILGKGSFATIWKVRHRKYGYVRTLKVLNTPVQDENDHAYQTFLKECRVLLNIGNGSNPNIVRIWQPRLIENRAVVEMDYIDGETLDQYLQHVRFMTISEVYRFISDIGGALAYCHNDIYKYMMNPNDDDLTPDPDDGRRYIIDEATKQRLVAKYAVTHNDLHSNNVMRRENDGSFVLLDFGLAIQDGKAVKSSAMRGGALEYMSPEKFDDNGVITTQSDIYSFGILLYETLAGRVPFVLGSNASFSDQTRLYQMHKTSIPPEIEPLRREAFKSAHPGQTYVKDYPDWLEDMIMNCLAKNPKDRYSNAKELYDDFKVLSTIENDFSSAKLHKRSSDNIHIPNLIPCPDCGRMISRKANACPNCGMPMTENQSKQPQKTTSILADEHPHNRISTTEETTSEHSPITNDIARTQFPTKISYIDLDLPSGLLWADRNIGASSPENSGDYFAWGEILPKSIYNWNTYLHCKGGSNKIIKYCNNPFYGDNGFSDNTVFLSADDDAATKRQEDNDVHIPKMAEWQELLDNTTKKWFYREGVKGMLFTSKNNNKSIFLPTAGYYWDGSCYYSGSNGYYWSDALGTDSPINAFGFFFNSISMRINSFYRYYGFCVRPVYSKH